MIDLVGKTVGSYRFDAVLGSGGFGKVYRGHHLQLDVPIALKILTQVWGGQKRLVRFKREAEAAQRLESPHVARVHEFTTIGHAPMIVQELVEGVNLESFVAQRGPLPVSQAIAIGIGVCRGLVDVHAAGLVHRDIKPDNVVITQDGTPKIVDFGLVQLQDSGDGTLTRAGSMVGTPHFLSPEQVSAQPGAIGPQADAYGLGGLLHFLVTGLPPHSFSPEDPIMEILARRLQGPPVPVRKVRPDIPESLCDLIQHLLAVDPDQRPTTPQALGVLSAFQEYAQAPDPAPAPVPAARRAPSGRSARSASGRSAQSERSTSFPARQRGASRRSASGRQPYSSSGSGGTKGLAIGVGCVALLGIGWFAGRTQTAETDPSPTPASTPEDPAPRATPPEQQPGPAPAQAAPTGPDPGPVINRTPPPPVEPPPSKPASVAKPWPLGWVALAEFRGLDASTLDEAEAALGRDDTRAALALAAELGADRATHAQRVAQVALSLAALERDAALSLDDYTAQAIALLERVDELVAQAPSEHAFQARALRGMARWSVVERLAFAAHRGPVWLGRLAQLGYHDLAQALDQAAGTEVAGEPGAVVARLALVAARFAHPSLREHYLSAASAAATAHHEAAKSASSATLLVRCLEGQANVDANRLGGLRALLNRRARDLTPRDRYDLLLLQSTSAGRPPNHVLSDQQNAFLLSGIHPEQRFQAGILLCYSLGNAGRAGDILGVLEDLEGLGDSRAARLTLAHRSLLRLWSDQRADAALLIERVLEGRDPALLAELARWLQQQQQQPPELLRRVVAHGLELAPEGPPVATLRLIDASLAGVEPSIEASLARLGTAGPPGAAFSEAARLVEQTGGRWPCALAIRVESGLTLIRSDPIVLDAEGVGALLSEADAWVEAAPDGPRRKRAAAQRELLRAEGAWLRWSSGDSKAKPRLYAALKAFLAASPDVPPRQRTEGWYRMTQLCMYAAGRLKPKAQQTWLRLALRATQSWAAEDRCATVPWLTKASALRGLGKLGQAQDALRVARANALPFAHEQAALLLEEALTLEAGGKQEEARVLAKQALELDPAPRYREVLERLAR